MTNRTYKALQTRVFQVLERAHSADRHSIYCDVFLAVLILGNLIAIVLESVSYLARKVRSRIPRVRSLQHHRFHH